MPHAGRPTDRLPSVFRVGLTSAFSMRDSVERLTALLSANPAETQLRVIRTCLIPLRQRALSIAHKGPYMGKMNPHKG